MLPLRVEKHLAVLGGSRRDAVEEVPQSLGRAALVGLANLASSLAAAFAVADALGSVFRGPAAVAIAVAAGLLAGAVVLNLNRALASRWDSAAGWPQRILQAGLRLAVALILSSSISLPWTLRVCEDAVLMELRSEQDQRLAGRAVRGPGVLDEIAGSIEKLDRLLAELERDLEAPEAQQYLKAQAELARAQGEQASIEQSLQPRLERDSIVLNRMLANPATDPRFIQAIRNQILEHQRALEQANQRIEQAQRELDAAALAWRQKRQQLLARGQAGLVQLRSGLQRILNPPAKPAIASESDPAEQLRPGFFNRWRALRRILSDEKHPEHRTVAPLALGLNLVLLLLELAPLLAGLLPPNALDRANEAMDFRDSERVVNRVNAEVLQWRAYANASDRTQDRSGSPQAGSAAKTN